MKHVCKICGSTETKKNGFVSGFQRYKCKACGHQFIKETPRGKPEQDKSLAGILYNFGVSQNFISRVLSVTPTSVGRWLSAEAGKNVQIETKSVLKTANELAEELRRREKINPSPFYTLTYRLKKHEINVLIKEINPKQQGHTVSACAFGNSILRGVIQNTKLVKYEILKDNFLDVQAGKKQLSCKNFAKHGSTVIDGETAFDTHLMEVQKSDYVFLLFGGNESAFDWDAVAQNPEKNHQPVLSIEKFSLKYTHLISKIKKQKKIPVLFSLPPIQAQWYFDFITQNRNKENILSFLNNDISAIYRWHEGYNLAIFKIAQENNVHLIDIRSEFLKMRNYTDFLSPDGIHLNKEGYVLIADIIRNTYQQDMTL